MHWRLPPAQQRVLEMAELSPGECVLDVACGSGLITFPAAIAVGERGKVVAIDISETLVDAVTSDARLAQLPQVTARRMDAEHLDFSDGSFDAVLCSLGLMYVADPLRALEEMCRVLRPDGRAVVAVWGPRETCGWSGVFDRVGEARRDFFALGVGSHLEDLMERAGLVNVDAGRLSTLLRYDSADEACATAFRGGPVAEEYARLAERTRDAVRAEYLTSIAPFARGDGYDIPAEFVVVRAFTPAPSSRPSA